MEISVAESMGLIMCFLLSGFFSGSEAVLMSIDIDRAKRLIEEGGAKGRALTFMIEKPSELLATILVGNNIVNIFAASLTTTIAARMFQDDAVGISVGVTTFIILIFGEIIPKTFARNHAERLCVFVIRVLQFCFYSLYPLIRGVVWIMETILGENSQLQGRLVTKKDIAYMVNKAEKEKTMDSKQLDMLTSILEFPKIKVKDIMVPRSRVKSIPYRATYKEIIDLVQADVHSRYPVIDGELEDVKGFLHVKDLAFYTSSKSFKIDKHLKDPFFVYEHMKIQAVFDHMNRKKIHLALVKDETGIVVGIVTLEDIVEEILGDIQDEHDRDEEYVSEEYKQADLEVGIVLDPSISLRDLDDDFEIEIPLNDNYSTLTGFILDNLGNTFPKQGQMILWEGYSFEILTVENNELKEIKIKSVDGEKHIFSKKTAASGGEEEGISEKTDPRLSLNEV
ncbi:MAG: hemolysin family protein [Bacteriovoracaceae bacterium]